MTNKIIIGGVVVVLVVVGSVSLLRGQESENPVETPTEAASASPTLVGTLQAAYKSGDSLKCSIDVSMQKFTFYFKDGNMRYETSLASGSTKVETGQIIKKDVAYAWTNMSSDIVTITDPKTIEFSRNTAFQLDTLISNQKSNVKLACVQISVSNSMFNKPKN